MSRQEVVDRINKKAEEIRREAARCVENAATLNRVADQLQERGYHFDEALVDYICRNLGTGGY